MQIRDFRKLKTVTVSIDNGIAEIIFCRPEVLNSINTLFWDELPAVLKTIDREAAARVAIISANVNISLLEWTWPFSKTC